MEHLSSVFLEANKLCSPSAVRDWGYRCRQVKVIFFFSLWKNHAKRMALHMHELYEGLTGGANSMSFLMMKVRNVNISAHSGNSTGSKRVLHHKSAWW